VKELLGMGQNSKPDRAFIDFGRPDGRKSSSYHVGYRLIIEGLNYEELRICETHMSPLVPDEAEMIPDGQRSINQRFHA
jgi:hypothetical protein